MKGQASSIPNKKLILHFDLQNVLALSSTDKDFYVLF